MQGVRIHFRVHVYVYVHVNVHVHLRVHGSVHVVSMSVIHVQVGTFQKCP
jgi:hypothetical protein